MEYGTTRTGSTFRTWIGCNDEEIYRSATGDRRDVVKEVDALVAVLQTTNGLRLFKTAYRTNMLYKIGKYAELTSDAEEEVTRQAEIIEKTMPDLKQVAGVQDDHNNWTIFESISEAYMDAKNRASTFAALHARATQCLEGTLGWEEVQPRDDIKRLRDQLVLALEELKNFASQQMVVSKVLSIVTSFIKNPRLFRTKLMNFMLVGGPGTGKTTLAEAMSNVFARAGIFVGNRLVVAGRAEMIGQYEGQTVHRTRDFLINNLDNGVVFIDEAYAVTPWHGGKPEGYGSEAATALVEFMTRYTGLYCIVVAGYEKEMRRYFLETNDGLSRRFPNKFALADMNADEMVHVFKRALVRAQGLEDDQLPSVEKYFTSDAWEYLTKLTHTCTRGTVSYIEEHDDATRRTYDAVRKFTPTWEYMYKLFENQAGSMTLLADEALGVLMDTITFQEIIHVVKKHHGASYTPAFKQQARGTMREIVVRTILKSVFTGTHLYLDQLATVESLI